jgi:hypothetical protein
VALLLIILVGRAIAGPEKGGPSGSGVTTTTLGAVESSTTQGSTTTSTEPVSALQKVELVEVATGLAQPVLVTSPPGDDRIFVVERVGRLTILEPDGTHTNFLDIVDRVKTDGIEQGMLGLAFHPDFADNGRFFVYYTNLDSARTLSEFAVGASPSEGDPDSEKILYSKPQPPRSTDIRHYGGMLQFGPDGYLYVSSGDGANASDQPQNLDSLFGKILRLDVDSGDPYGTPSDNPFADGGGAPEVWAYGLRNPWRYWIDATGGNIYIGDVGFGEREEVDVVSLAEGAGSNFGWANVEGTVCFQEDPCDPADYVLPAVEYDHEAGCSITGGVVYRGEDIPEIQGTYFYTDWCKGWIRSFIWDNGQVTEEKDWSEELGNAGQIDGFGVDSRQEMYIATHDGKVLKFVPVR